MSDLIKRKEKHILKRNAVMYVSIVFTQDFRVL